MRSKSEKLLQEMNYHPSIPVMVNNTKQMPRRDQEFVLCADPRAVRVNQSVKLRIGTSYTPKERAKCILVGRGGLGVENITRSQSRVGQFKWLEMLEGSSPVEDSLQQSRRGCTWARSFPFIVFSFFKIINNRSIFFHAGECTHLETATVKATLCSSRVIQDHPAPRASIEYVVIRPNFQAH